MNTIKTMNKKDLEQLMHEFDCTMREAALEVLYNFYEAAGFESEMLADEFGKMTDAELFACFDNLYSPENN